MSDKPVLFLPRPAKAQRAPRGGGVQKTHYPSHQRQVQRLTPVFEELRRAIHSDNTSLRATAYDTEPEQVLVLETVGSVENFIAAVQASGMDWLGEFDIDDVPPDDDFFDTEQPAARLSAHVFLVMANQRGLEQMLRLWDRFTTDDRTPFPRGSATLKTVFGQLRALRRWGVEDRLRETEVVKYWREDLALAARAIRFEAELFFRCDETRGLQR